jgi:hypothetical protein
MPQSSSSASSFVSVPNADGSTNDLTPSFTMEGLSDAFAASSVARSETPFDDESQNGQGCWRWKPDTTKNYNSTDGIYFVIPWKREMGSDSSTGALEGRACPERQQIECGSRPGAKGNVGNPGQA